MIGAVSYRIGLIAVVCCFCFALSSGNAAADPLIIDHRHTDITVIPQSAIEQAKTRLHIAYGHTSHGSQLTSGMKGLVDFVNNGGKGLSLPHDILRWNNGGTDGALDFRDRPFSRAADLGNPNRTAWAGATRNYLDDNSEVNVIIWSWCGQVSNASESDIDTYLDLMNRLEQDYPDVRFVYMTGHLDGSGADGNLHLRNEQIRRYCIENDKILYDFADIESYDPDAQVNYNELMANDQCAYDGDSNGSRESNWASQWQRAHTLNLDWYDCGSAHSQPLNANQKAYAAWWLWAVLGGWNATGVNHAPVMASIDNRQVTCDHLLEFTVSAIDRDKGDVLTYGIDPLPAGATFDSTSGMFRWTPTCDDQGDYPIVFSVTDNATPPADDQTSMTLSVVASDGGINDDSNNDSDNSSNDNDKNNTDATQSDDKATTDSGGNNDSNSDDNGCFINALR